MDSNPRISITQLSYGMTPLEMISEGHVDVDYFYDPDEEETKKALAEEEQRVRESGWEEDGEEF